MITWFKSKTFYDYKIYMDNINKKFFCDVCQYGTNSNNSYKKHLKTSKHMKNTRESSVKLDIVKYEDINIEICGNKDKHNEIDKSMKFIEKMTDELTSLRQENTILKANIDNSRNYSPIYKCSNKQIYDCDYDDERFVTIFDDDFSCLFR